VTEHKKCILIADQGSVSKDDLDALIAALPSMETALHGFSEPPAQVMKDSFIIEGKNLSANLVVMVGDVPPEVRVKYFAVSNKGSLRDQGLTLVDRQQVPLKDMSPEAISKWLDSDHYDPPTEDDDLMDSLLSIMDAEPEPFQVSIEMDEPELASEDAPQPVKGPEPEQKVNTDLPEILMPPPIPTNVDLVKPMEQPVIAVPEPIIPTAVEEPKPEPKPEPMRQREPEPIQPAPTPRPIAPPEQLGMFALLQIVGGMAIGQVVEFPEGEYTIGRHVDSSFLIDDRSVSRSHASLSVTPLGVTLSDKGSANGLIINGRDVQSVAIAETTEVVLGDITVRISPELREAEEEAYPLEDATTVAARPMTNSSSPAVQATPTPIPSPSPAAIPVAKPEPAIASIPQAQQNAAPAAIPLPGGSIPLTGNAQVEQSVTEFPQPPSIMPLPNDGLNMPFPPAIPAAIPGAMGPESIPLPQPPAQRPQNPNLVAPAYNAETAFPPATQGTPLPWEQQDNPYKAQQQVRMGDNGMSTQATNQQGSAQMSSIDDQYARNHQNQGHTPFEGVLTPGERAEQARQESNRSLFGVVETHADRRMGGNSVSKLIYVTGSHGGAGKTTCAWMMSNVLAWSYRNLGIDTPVFLIEADYRNPKLGARLNNRSANLGDAAKEIKGLQTRNLVTADNIVRIIEQVTTQQQDTGLNVITCPYNVSGVDSYDIKHAIMTAARVATSASVGGIAFIDAGTMTSGGFDQLDSVLGLHMASSLVLVTEDDPEHRTDADRTMGLATKGEGSRLNINQVFGFLNRTTPDAVKNYQVDSPFQIAGYLPYAPELKERWVGAASNEVIQAFTVRIGQALVRLGFDELRGMYDQQVKTKVKGRLRRSAGRR